MEFFEKSISNLIENQFPDFYREEGPVFVEFVKSYYEWMESENNPLYHSRRLLEYRDIDSTIDSFLIHFKNKYLNNIQFNTAVDTKRLVKHSLDLYRSKGTERAIELFFRSVFDVEASVYYPSKDIFKSSSGTWVEPLYIEVGFADNIADFEHLQIQGVNSGSTAFVERYIKKRSIGSAYNAEVLYISNLVGDFQTGEKIKSTKTGEVGPIIIGSLTTLDILDGAIGYSVGDIVTLVSDQNGRDGVARVANVKAISGKVTFTLDNGGWGYNANSEVLISNNTLTIANASSSAFEQFETIIQPMATIQYNSLTGPSFVVGDPVYKFEQNTGSSYAQGTIISVTASNSTAGSILISTGFDHMDESMWMSDETADTITTEDNISIAFNGIPVDANGSSADGDGLTSTYGTQANIVSYTDATVSANVMKYSANVNIEISNSAITSFSNNEFVAQYSNTGIEIANGMINLVSYFGTRASISLANTKGAFSNGMIYSKSSNASGYIDSISLGVGIISANGDFISANNNMVYGLNSNTYGTISRISSGFGASFTLSSLFRYTEDVSINTDRIGYYSEVLLNAPDYGFPKAGVENFETNIGAALSYDANSYGQITEITIRNNGIDYDTSPYVVIYEPTLYSYDKRDYLINLSNSVGSFITGEIVLQNGLQRGTVKAGSNSSLLYVSRISFEDIVIESGLVGALSGATSNVTSINVDVNSSRIGLNAVVIANTASSNGAVVQLDVTDSGFSYAPGEILTFVSSNSAMSSGTAISRLGKQGRAAGFYKENNSVLSGDKYLQDSQYYQEFSYEIRSPITVDKYADLLKNIIHISGTKHFSNYVFQTDLDTSSDIGPSQLTLS